LPSVLLDSLSKHITRARHVNSAVIAVAGRLGLAAEADYKNKVQSNLLGFEQVTKGAEFIPVRGKRRSNALQFISHRI